MSRLLQQRLEVGLVLLLGRVPGGALSANKSSLFFSFLGCCGTGIKIFLHHLQVGFVALLGAVAADIVNRNDDRRQALRLVPELLGRRERLGCRLRVPDPVVGLLVEALCAGKGSRATAEELLDFLVVPKVHEAFQGSRDEDVSLVSYGVLRRPEICLGRPIGLLADSEGSTEHLDRQG